jgi:hypothetical protein
LAGLAHISSAFSPTCQSTIRLCLKMIHEERNVATTPKVKFGQVIFQLPPTIRRIESLSKKIINAEAAISFNKKNTMWYLKIKYRSYIQYIYILLYFVIPLSVFPIVNIPRYSTPSSFTPTSSSLTSLTVYHYHNLREGVNENTTKISEIDSFIVGPLLISNLHSRFMHFCYNVCCRPAGLRIVNATSYRFTWIDNT